MKLKVQLVKLEKVMPPQYGMRKEAPAKLLEDDPGATEIVEEEDNNEAGDLPDADPGATESVEDDALTVVDPPWKILLVVVTLLPMLSSMYPSATLLERHPPCLFSVWMSAPLSASRVADVRRIQWPV
jgi:hypothetical protein